MKYLAALTSAILFLTPLPVVMAQSPAQQAVVKPAASPTPAAGLGLGGAYVDVNAATPLAILNGQTITVIDLDPAIAREVAKLPENIAQARRQILELQINTVLLDVEAKKRKLTPQKLYEQEVKKRLTDPTDAEIAQFLAANGEQLGESDPAALRAEAIAYLKADREQKLSDEFSRRLRTTNPVLPGADLNSAEISSGTVVTTVAGQAITAGNLAERLKPVIYSLRLKNYQIINEALSRTLNDLLLLAEANRRNVPPESILRSEVTEKVHTPTDAEVEKFYKDNKARIPGELSAVRNQIAAYLRQLDEGRLEQSLGERLRNGAQLRVLLTEPEPPVQVVGTAGEPARGNLNAPVTVVEFTDFQCPACAGMQPVLDEVLPTYGNRVRFVVRNFPLSRHVHARKAAEAADAANAQGKFFDYTALLFKRQSALDLPSLKKYASEVGLDRVRFDAELDSGKYADDVQHDLDDGQINGIDSTPTIFINGVKLTELSPEGLRAAIDKALAKAGVR
jgi:protein-disulfide isomerase